MPLRRLLAMAAWPAVMLTAVTLATPGHALAQSGAPVDVAGVRFAPTVSVAGSSLQLNGTGIRYRFVVKVYAAGLYLATKATNTEAVLAAPGPKRMHVVMLREINANDLGKLFTRGMQDNAPREEFSRSIPGTIRMSDIFSSRKKLVAGESFSVDWIPGQGTVIRVNGEVQGEPIREPEFFHALMRIWLGTRPADDQLKDALLGAPRQPQGNPGQQQ